MAEIERTLIIVKPDGMQRGLIGTILTRFEQRGLKIVALRLRQIETALAERHYEEHRARPFFSGLVSYITSTPVVVAVLEGPGAIAAARSTMGATNPAQAAPGTIRGDLGLEIGRNLVHGSDSAASAAREIALFFPPDEIAPYERAVDPWITEG
jgi:nucleoside-diphosphate kinase